MQQAPTAQQVRVSGSTELVAARIEDRRRELQEHRPNGPRAIVIAAEGLSSAAKLANGHTPELRADRQVRMRLMQFDGSKAMPLEDVAVIALESQLGRDVALTMLRPIVEAVGYRLVAVETSTVQDRRRAAIGAVSQFSRTTQEVVAALEDGEIDDAEEARIDREMEEAESRVRLWKAARSARRVGAGGVK